MQNVTKYNQISRWSPNFNTDTKKQTIKKLNNLLESQNSSNRLLVVKCIAKLIEFKEGRQNKDGGTQEKALQELSTLCIQITDNVDKITLDELMELVKNQSYLFQRVLP